MFKTTLLFFALLSICPVQATEMYKYSSTIEKERPQLSEETKKRIAVYLQNPTEENKAALRRQTEINYDKVVEHKKAKLEELK
ncbi:MAG: hypothetical protein IJ752_05010 [Alphaproteobacteria bacterium]|nr:hypothetical protein [Alphaproteobacteria bacterium]